LASVGKVMELPVTVTLGEVAPAPRLSVIEMLHDPPVPDPGGAKAADHVPLLALNPPTAEDPAQPVPPQVALLRDVGAVPT
jgi:hypothetical protein